MIASLYMYILLIELQCQITLNWTTHEEQEIQMYILNVAVLYMWKNEYKCCYYYCQSPQNDSSNFLNSWSNGYYSFFLEISVFEVKRNITERVNHLYKSSFKGSTFNLNFSFACVKFWRKEFYFHLILNKFYFALKWNLSPPKLFAKVSITI